MPHRVSGHGGPGNEVDISNALLDNSSSFGSDDDGQHPDRRARMLAPGENPDLEGDYSSDDAGFINEVQTASNRKNGMSKSKTKSGGFQAMGLNPNLLKAITKKGFSIPTPIQRKTIPLILDRQDVVGMARTGSGKTGAFVIPMIEQFKKHSPKVGARGLILSPSRELALQTLKVVKELGRGTDLKCVLLVGGESLEEQFASMAGNPDILIATPGRFMHLKVEMSLDLSSIRYVVFDEADRLFELGFAAQLTEILHALPQTRQTLMFSATLPKSLVEFARAGLAEPHLLRLDSESKISPDLQSAFFTLKSHEKEGALLHILADVVKVPTGTPEAASVQKAEPTNGKKRKREGPKDGKGRGSPTDHSTIVFTATKHHVDYLATLLRQSGYSVSHCYGSLDQTARKIQVSDFTTGLTHILVVTDVAARGIDIPILANVINFDFPAQPKIFVHRVGRTARAGQRGWSYSLVRDADLPYLLDLQLFLGKRLVLGQEETHPNYTDNVNVGSFVQGMLETHCEWATKLLDEDAELATLKSVAAKGEKLCLKTRNAASVESIRRSKEITNSRSWNVLHPLFVDERSIAEAERADMLTRVSGFRPSETVFEIGRLGPGEEVSEMKKRRMTFEKQKKKHQIRQNAEHNHSWMGTEVGSMAAKGSDLSDKDDSPDPAVDMNSASDAELDITFPQTTANKATRPQNFQDSDFFMSYNPSTMNLAEDRSYGVHSGGNSFVSAARSATMDLVNDDGETGFCEPSRLNGMRWDKRHKKYVARANDEDGSKGRQMIKGESGQKIAASFRSGRFDAWKKSNRITRLPRTGETESSAHPAHGAVGKRYKHKTEKAPKEADKYRDDFYKRKKMVEKAKTERRGRFKEGTGKREIKGIDDVRKERGLKERRREKNARPGKRR